MLSVVVVQFVSPCILCGCCVGAWLANFGLRSVRKSDMDKKRAKMNFSVIDSQRCCCCKSNIGIGCHVLASRRKYNIFRRKCKYEVHDLRKQASEVTVVSNPAYVVARTRQTCVQISEEI